LSPIRVGIIGTGFGAGVQLPGFQCVEGVEVAAIVSTRMDRARAVAAEHGVPYAFADYREMLRSVPLDLVSVAVPPYLHYEMTLAALEAGAHVLCEKPLAMNTEQAREMLAAAQRAGRVHAVDHEFRYVPARATVKRLLDEGAVGEPYLVRIADLVASRPERYYGWWFDRARGGGLLQAIGAHYVDAVRWWISPIDRLTAQLSAIVPTRPTEDETQQIPVTADDTALIAFSLENGAVGRIDLGAVAKAGLRRVEIYGSAGTLIMEGGAKVYRSQGGDLEEIIPDGSDQGRLDDPRLGSFVELAQRVADRIRGRDSGSFTTFVDGVEIQRVMDAIHLSSDEQREVRIAEIP
jgi:predicted dehydrogenase